VLLKNANTLLKQVGELYKRSDGCFSSPRFRTLKQPEPVRYADEPYQLDKPVFPRELSPDLPLTPPPPDPGTPEVDYNKKVTLLEKRKTPSLSSGWGVTL
jgi:hypothetical protein